MFLSILLSACFIGVSMFMVFAMFPALFLILALFLMTVGHCSCSGSGFFCICLCLLFSSSRLNLHLCWSACFEIFQLLGVVTSVSVLCLSYVLPTHRRFSRGTTCRVRHMASFAELFLVSVCGQAVAQHVVYDIWPPSRSSFS